jgi:type I restriction enzyme S subunit
MTESWNLKSIDEIAEIGRGRSRHRPRNAPELYGGVYPFVQTADIHASDLYINTFSKTYNEAGLAQSKLWDSGVICITNAGENTGDCAILGIQACVPDSIITVIPDPEETDPVFLKYAIDQLKSQLRAVTKGATQDNLSIAKLTAFKFQVPSVATQKQIGHILRCYGDLIENNRRRIQLLERSLHLLYKEWFVHLRFPSHEHSKIVDGIPEGWRKCQISELGNIVRAC